LAVFEPVRTIAEFKRLDDGEVLAGYFDGFSGEPVDAALCSRSYWHGWKNGMVESERWLPDDDYCAMQEAFELKRAQH